MRTILPSCKGRNDVQWTSSMLLVLLVLGQGSDALATGPGKEENEAVLGILVRKVEPHHADIERGQSRDHVLDIADFLVGRAESGAPDTLGLNSDELERDTAGEDIPNTYSVQISYGSPELEESDDDNSIDGELQGSDEGNNSPDELESAEASPIRPYEYEGDGAGTGTSDENSEDDNGETDEDLDYGDEDYDDYYDYYDDEDELIPWYRYYPVEFRNNAESDQNLRTPNDANTYGEDRVQPYSADNNVRLPYPYDQVRRIGCNNYESDSRNPIDLDEARFNSRLYPYQIGEPSVIEDGNRRRYFENYGDRRLGGPDMVPYVPIGRPDFVPEGSAQRDAQGVLTVHLPAGALGDIKDLAKDIFRIPSYREKIPYYERVVARRTFMKANAPQRSSRRNEEVYTNSPQTESSDATHIERVPEAMGGGKPKKSRSKTSDDYRERRKARKARQDR